MLHIEDLKVELAGKIILKHIDLDISPGETHILFGPNGSGKTSLLMTIMGYPQYKVVSGKIVFKGEDITYMAINERAQLGIGMSYQRPPTINGLKTRQIVNLCAKGDIDAEDLAKKVNFIDFLDRDIDRTIKALLTKLEPALTVIMGAIVGFILMAVYLPMFDYMQYLK